MKRVPRQAILLAMMMSVMACKTTSVAPAAKTDATTGATKVKKESTFSTDQVKEKVRALLAEKRFLSLVTIDAAKNPVVRAVVYVNDRDSIYVLSERDNKVKQVIAHPNIAFSINHYDEDWTKLLAIQMQGVGSVLQNTTEKEKAITMIQEKFAQYASMPIGVEDVEIMKLLPTKGIFLDNPSGYGTKLEVRYQ